MTSTQFEQPAHERTVTAVEAEQVVALWAKRQQENDSNLSIHDLAEALGTSAPEIESLLASVRTVTEAVPAVVIAPETKPRRRRSLRFLVAFIGLVAIGAIGFAVVRQAELSDDTTAGIGVTAAAPVAIPPAPTAEQFIPAMRGPDTEDVSANVPQGFTVRFDGYVAKGRAQPNGYPEARLETNLQDEIRLMTPTPVAVPALTDARSRAIEGLTRGQDVEGILAYKNASITYARGTSTERIPIALTRQESVSELVDAAQQIAVRRLASRAAAGSVDSVPGQ